MQSKTHEVTYDTKLVSPTAQPQKQFQEKDFSNIADQIFGKRNQKQNFEYKDEVQFRGEHVIAHRDKSSVQPDSETANITNNNSNNIFKKKKVAD